jgi:integrase
MSKIHEITEHNRPLSSSEKETVIDAATNAEPAAKISVLLPLFSGIKANPASHLRDYMISTGEKGLQIELPPGKHECVTGGNDRGSASTDWGLTSGPCSSCCDNKGNYEFSKPRVVPIRATEAVSVIVKWFELYSQMPGNQAICSRISRLGEKVGITRLSPMTLRHTFGVMLAKKGFSQEQMGKILGLSQASIESGYIRDIYGERCAGSNPFKCGVELVDAADDDRCQSTVYNPDSGLCKFHETLCEE